MLPFVAEYFKFLLRVEKRKNRLLEGVDTKIKKCSALKG
jgi:hypothetical protein